MIDAKFNELAPETEATKTDKKLEGGTGTGTGLSINDTIAGAASLSTGARGVETSGVSAGAGVGAGMTHTTVTTSGESPAPTIVPGERSSGTTARGGSNTQSPSSAMPSAAGESYSEGSNATGDSEYSLSTDDIASHAYRCWHERGCPDGSPEVDWHRAETELRSRRTKGANA